jgi:hypothetical protein
MNESMLRTIFAPAIMSSSSQNDKEPLQDRLLLYVTAALAIIVVILVAILS